MKVWVSFLTVMVWLFSNNTGRLVFASEDHGQNSDGSNMINGSTMMDNGMFGFGFLGMLIFLALIGVVVYTAVKLANRKK
ncbi:hypothetical protein [Halobacillus amylolyticus]|uniref:Uncharacterized protein n=1 Tax=Halobacillus amylolyticus TaxID=2932259 RepID=A0ABY4HBP0_9BACI|nr:hypothetical protein [Halobacillus amylolyticus]UOR12092.1 hypothetical protein MUO15_00670 [Halobacillus amylolyticus]